MSGQRNCLRKGATPETKYTRVWTGFEGRRKPCLGLTYPTCSGRVGTLGECISEGMIAFDVTYTLGLPFAFLTHKFALDKVGGLLGL